MIPKFALRLTPKFALIYVLLAAVLLVFVGVPAYFSGRSALQAATTADLLSTAIEKQAALERWIAERQMDLGVLATSPYLLGELDSLARASDLAAVQAAHDRLAAELRRSTAAMPGFLDMFIMDPQTGQITVSTDAGEEGAFREDLPYFVNGKNGPYVQNPYYVLSLQATGMTVSIPLRAAGGQLLGVLAGQLNLSEMNLILARESGQRQTEDAFLVNASSLFVTQPRLLSDPAVLLRGIHTVASQRCLASNSGVTLADDYRGIPAIIVYRWLPDRQLCLIVKVDQAEALQPVWSFGLALAGIGAVALVAASLLGIRLAQTLTYPILALQSGVTRLEHGERDVHLSETSGDELGALGRAFNSMAASLAEKDRQLREYATGLEQKVDDRTAQLRESEQRLRLYVEHAPAAIAMLDQDMRYLLISRRWLTDYRLQEQDVIGRSHYELFPDLPERWKAIHQRCLKGAMERAEADPFPRADGTLDWVHWEIYPWRRSNGEIGGILIFSEVITARKLAEEALRESEGRYRSLFENMLNGFAYCKMEFDQGRPSDFVYLEVNNAFETLTGLKDVVGKKVSEVIPGIQESDPALIARYGRVALTGQPEQFEVYVEGLAMWFSISVYSPAKEYFVAVFDVITARKRAEEALQRSEQRYRLLAENVRDVIWTMDNDRRFTYISPSIRLLRGYEPEEAVKESLEQTMTPESFQIVQKQAEERAQAEARGEMDLVNYMQIEQIRKDGSLVWVEILTQPLLDDAGQRIGFVGVSRDITERKRVETALRDSEKRFRSLIEQAPIAITIAHNRALIYANPAYLTMYGLESSTELIGRPTIERVAPESAAASIERTRRREQGLPVETHYEFMGLRPNGSIFPVVADVVRVNLSDESINIGFFQDITERRRIENEIRSFNAELERRVAERTAQLEAVNKELEAFSYSVSHDLRAPLRAIDGFSRIVMRDYEALLPPEGQHRLQQVRDNAQQMGRLIDDLLAFARLGRQPLSKQPVIVTCLVTEVLEGLSTERENRQVEIVLGDLPACQADPALLKQVFVNLLSNALKFTRPRDVARLEVGSRAIDGELVYYVKDNGTGFDMRYVDKLFGVFQRLHRAEDYEGNGVGLATVQRIIARHGGRVWAEAEVDKGATFFFTLGAI